MLRSRSFQVDIDQEALPEDVFGVDAEVAWLTSDPEAGDLRQHLKNVLGL